MFLGQKFIWVKKCLGQKKFGSKKVLGQKIFLVKQNFWSKKIQVKKIRSNKILVKKIFDKNKFLDQKFVWSNKIFGPEKFLVPKKLWFWKKKLVKNILGQKNFGSKKFLAQDFGSKIFLVQASPSESQRALKIRKIVLAPSERASKMDNSCLPSERAETLTQTKFLVPKIFW